MGRVSRKVAGAVLAPVAAALGVGLGASPASAESGSAYFAFANYVGVGIACTVSYQLNYDASRHNLYVQVVTSGDNDCYSTDMAINVVYTQDGSNSTVHQSLGAETTALSAQYQGVKDARIDATYSVYFYRCNPEFNDTCTSVTTLTHGK